MGNHDDCLLGRRYRCSDEAASGSDKAGHISCPVVIPLFIHFGRSLGRTYLEGQGGDGMKV